MASEIIKDEQLRAQLVKLMRGGQAFRTRAELLEGLTLEVASHKVDGLPYTIWQLLEHMRLTQHDILEFSQNPGYKEPNWPDDYWPAGTAPENKEQMEHTLKAIDKDLDQMVKLVQDKDNDLQEPFPHGQGQTLLREAMLIAEHNAYHLGQIVLLRKLLGDLT